MSNECETTPLKSNRSIPADIQALFGDPPLLISEDPDVYWEMFRLFAESVAPRNIIEWLWVKDIVDLSWEIARLRRYRALLIEGERERKNAYIEFKRENAASRSLNNDLSRAAIEERRNAPRLDTEADSANLLMSEYLDKYEIVDKLLMAAELRRDRILRELDFRRERIAPLLRKTSDELIDASADPVPLAAD
jgi:hypothetical protein